MRLLILNLLVWMAASASAQTLTHGPIVGAVGADSARIYLRTSAATAVEVTVLDTTGLEVAAVVTNTLAANDNSAIVTVSGLTPHTPYVVLVDIQGTTQSNVASFRSAPAAGQAGYYKFLMGSCIGELMDADSALFVQARSENADMMIYYGDWGYPDDDINLTYPFLGDPIPPFDAPTSYAEDWNLIYESYRERYASTNSGFFNRSLALAYVYDDHDYLNDNSGSNFAGGYLVPDPFNLGFQPYAPNWAEATGAPISIPQPPVCRQNIIEAYTELFPHYELPDTSQGIYHSFRYGNVEFFVLDLRASRSAQQDNIRENPVGSGNWEFLNPAGNSILGAEQRDWLLNGLRNSTADWKFIVSSVTFNISNQYAFDSVIAIGSGTAGLLGNQLQGLPIQPTGYIVASRYADKWVGYPSDLDSVMQVVLSPGNPAQRIPNVFMISGDTHNSALDDGYNSGVPELMAGQLKRSNRREARENQDFMGWNIWNRGGSGLCTNDNYSTNYGKVEVFGQDSVRLSAVDPQGNTIFTGTFLNNEGYLYPFQNYTPNFQPNPAADAYTTDTATILMDVLANDTDPEGDSLFVVLVELPQSGNLTLDPLTNELTYTPDQPGNFAFRYKACDNANPHCPSCKEAVGTITVNPLTGSPEPEFARSGFDVYPNPAWTKVNIRLREGQIGVPYSFVLLNPLGQEVRRMQFVNLSSLNVTELPGGYYLYRILDAQGHQHQAGRINVQH
jgi:phosphodiesterase/alkaline phosphatase D-like protein